MPRKKSKRFLCTICRIATPRFSGIDGQWHPVFVTQKMEPLCYMCYFTENFSNNTVPPTPSKPRRKRAPKPQAPPIDILRKRIVRDYE